MSFWKDENNEVHKSDIAFNGEVVEIVRKARTSEKTSDLINALAKGKTANQLSHEADVDRVNARAEWAKREEIGIAEQERER